MKTLDKCENLFGRLGKDSRGRIRQFLEEPTYENWVNTRSLIINSKMVTIWQALAKINPVYTNGELLPTEFEVM